MSAELNVAIPDRIRGGTRQRVYTALRDALVAGELAPGRRLSENELAEWLGVSRTPVREALVRLRDDRLVEIVPQFGTFVSKISIASVTDAQFVREALECAAIRLTAEQVAEKDLEGLMAIIADQDQAHAAGDFAAFYESDDRFHAALCALSGRSIAWSVVQRADGHLNRVRRLSLQVPEYMGEMISEHRDVVAALGKHDPDEAEAVLRHHLRMVLSGLEPIRAEHPGYFEEDE